MHFCTKIRSPLTCWTASPSRLEEMSRKVNSLHGNVISLPTESIATVPVASVPTSETYASSTRSLCAGDWLLLSDMDVNLDKRWCLGDFALDYQGAFDLLNL